eukprot:TRINITY_DN16664_c0_g1_i2.p1 TRINITY_DN16664_c0_g1~~TRINITY_DN16664_c0_g1_i2.p1  ORF type:complete len:163 (+),score=41.89 TRINITY_DN16664_c0_g1_i2:50-490(+)
MSHMAAKSGHGHTEGTTHGGDGPHTVKIYNPTYLMKPREGTKFLKRDVEVTMQQILHEKLQNKEYDPAEQSQLTKELCTEIQTAVKKMGYERYKIVIQVNITEATGQGIRIASRCLWDPEQDNYAEAVYKNQYLWCCALCFGCYWE